MNHSEIILSIHNFILNSGDFAYIYGDNRSGKSLFLSCLGNCYPHYNGYLKLNHENVNDKHYSTLIRLIRNENIVLPDQGIIENIGLGHKNKLENNEDLIELLTQFKMPFEKNIKCAMLSQSEQKSIELIRAYIQKPLMLLFDDLDNYFDSKHFEGIYNLLLKMKKNGTIIIATGKSQFNTEKQFIIQDKGLVLK